MLKDWEAKVLSAEGAEERVRELVKKLIEKIRK